jgi:hypothetical protein
MEAAGLIIAFKLCGVKNRFWPMIGAIASHYALEF